jgi:hypothetical protein
MRKRADFALSRNGQATGRDTGNLILCGFVDLMAGAAFVEDFLTGCWITLGGVLDAGGIGRDLEHRAGRHLQPDACERPAP